MAFQESSGQVDGKDQKTVRRVDVSFDELVPFTFHPFLCSADRSFEERYHLSDLKYELGEGGNEIMEGKRRERRRIARSAEEAVTSSTSDSSLAGRAIY